MLFLIIMSSGLESGHGTAAKHEISYTTKGPIAYRDHASAREEGKEERLDFFLATRKGN